MIINEKVNYTVETYLGIRAAGTELNQSYEIKSICNNIRFFIGRIQWAGFLQLFV